MRDRIGSWGAAEFDRRFGVALRGFAGWAREWLTIVHSAGADAMRSTYLEVLAGAAKPAEAHILVPE
ncbi:MAG: hypothetical protein GEV28_08725 [Actinophytocola sp.]|uniref:hypothetical protein n=1 Tax=Actinophytocola sp. TaxID=1872138 RepID=UPI001327AE26|nr:hypothetical protein [Actinophytocola sp.]MPZ80461.1 hypothetical protein [Actinophytocola sp.]